MIYYFCLCICRVWVIWCVVFIFLISLMYVDLDFDMFVYLIEVWCCSRVSVLLILGVIVVVGVVRLLCWWLSYLVNFLNDFVCNLLVIVLFVLFFRFWKICGVGMWMLGFIRIKLVFGSCLRGVKILLMFFMCMGVGVLR